MKEIIETYKCWMINANSDEGHGLLGRYWWFRLDCPNIPAHMLGHMTAAFETRREAREALKNVRKTFPKSKVERVSIDVVKEY